MKVTVYVDWNEYAIISEADFKKEVLSEADERFNDSDFFDAWLSSNFDHSEVFNFTESEKETQRARFKERCLEAAQDYLFDNKYEAIDLEV